MANTVSTAPEKVSIYRSANQVFEGLLKEMKELSKKKADATLSKGKVKILNRVLEDLKLILQDEPESKYLDLLDDDDLPQNSDAVLVMVQYQNALKAFHARYRQYDRARSAHFWSTTSGPEYKD